MSAFATSAIAAPLLAATAAWLAVAPGGRGVQRVAAAGVVAPVTFPFSRLPTTALLTSGVAVAAAAVLVFGARPAVAAAGGVVVVALVRFRTRSRRRRDRRRLHGEVVRACDALAAELAAGTHPHRALDQVAAEWSVLRPAASSARMGADVAAAIRVASRAPGAEGLSTLAAATDVGARTGAPLAAVLDRAVEALRADEELAREVDAALGPPRATARLLAVLPIAGLGLGMGLGGDPVGFLLTTEVGSYCLLLGVAIAISGITWVDRIADGATR